MEHIPDTIWYCPECQQKQTSEVQLTNQVQYKDRNFSFDMSCLSMPAITLIQTIIKGLKSEEITTIDKSLFQNVSISDLIQIQSCKYSFPFFNLVRFCFM